MRIESENNEAPSKNIFDMVICALGYETRARHVIEQLRPQADTKLAISFGYNETLQFKNNRSLLEAEKFSILENSVDALMGSMALNQSDIDRPFEILLDISSMSKDMHANAIFSIFQKFRGRLIRIHTAYAPSQFFPAREIGPIEMHGPVTKEFSGWSAKPEKPISALVGLGNDIGLAVGAIQSIEPSLLWTFTAKGIDERFEASVREANKDIEELFQLSNFNYSILDMTGLRRMLSNLITEVSQTHRVIIIPFGPKILSYTAVLSVLIGEFKEAAIWRFSAGSRAEPVDRFVDGEVVWHNITLKPYAH